jgi:lysophospholipase L1-like esterase
MLRLRHLSYLLACSLLVACASQREDFKSNPARAEVQSTGRSLRTADGWQVTWPAVAWRTAFYGTAIGIDSQDLAGYHVEIDGQVMTAVPATPVRMTTWYSGLAPGRHLIEAIRMGPTRRAPGTFYGFARGAGGRWLTMPAPSKRQLLVIGDSIATGYGDLSASVDCPDNVLPFTDAAQSFGVVAARSLQADWQLNAMDGIGLVRNWNGLWPGTNYQTYASRTLQSDDALNYADSRWQPQVAVLAIGANDLSTPLAAGEPWTDTSLRQAFTAAEHHLLTELRRNLGRDALIIVMIDPSVSNPANEIIQAQVEALRAAGDQRIFLLPMPSLERTGCYWHPSLAAHRLVGQLLAQFIRDHQGFEYVGSNRL